MTKNRAETGKKGVNGTDNGTKTQTNIYEESEAHGMEKRKLWQVRYGVGFIVVLIVSSLLGIVFVQHIMVLLNINTIIDLIRAIAVAALIYTVFSADLKRNRKTGVICAAAMIVLNLLYFGTFSYVAINRFALFPDLILGVFLIAFLLRKGQNGKSAWFVLSIVLSVLFGLLIYITPMLIYGPALLGRGIWFNRLNSLFRYAAIPFGVKATVSPTSIYAQGFGNSALSSYLSRFGFGKTEASSNKADQNRENSTLENYKANLKK